MKREICTLLKSKSLSLLLVLTTIVMISAFLLNTDFAHAGTFVELSEENFPDDIFREELCYFDDDWDGYLSEDEIKNIKELDFFGYGIKDLSGIKYLTELESLDVSDNNLTSLDISGRTALKYLSCTHNSLTSLDVNGCIALEDLSCGGNKLTSLDTSGCFALEGLGCESNSLTRLQILGLTKLQELYCAENRLTSLIVTGCSELEEIECNRNNLSYILVNGSPELGQVSCDDSVTVYCDGKIHIYFTPTFEVGLPTCVFSGKSKGLPLDYTYDGKAKEPEVISVKVANATLGRDSDYTVSYGKNKAVGFGIVTIEGVGHYTGSITAYFNINPKGTTISKLTKGSKGFTVKWKKQSAKMDTSRINGYQIRYSTKSSMSGSKTKTITGYSKTSKKVTGLKSHTKYYVQVRTYKTIVDGTKYYSGWSPAKKVTTK